MEHDVRSDMKHFDKWTDDAVLDAGFGTAYGRDYLMAKIRSCIAAFGKGRGVEVIDVMMFTLNTHYTHHI
jgi:hypothetical protein